MTRLPSARGHSRGVPSTRMRTCFTDGMADAVYTNWRSVIGPPAMARPQVAYWEGALAQAVQSDDWKRDLERNFWTANFLTGEPARQYVAQQGELFRAIFTELGLAKK